MKSTPQAPIEVLLFGKTFRVRIQLHQYEHRGLAVQLVIDGNDDPDCVDGEAFSTISIWLPETLTLPPHQFYVKHWDENSGVIGQLLAQGVIEPVPNAPICQAGYIPNIKAYQLRTDNVPVGWSQIEGGTEQ